MWLKIWADGCRRVQQHDKNSLQPLHIDEAVWNDREAFMRPSGRNKGRVEDHREYTLVDNIKPPTSPPPTYSPRHVQHAQLFYFSPESLQALKEEAQPSKKTSSEPSDQEWISTNDAVSALVWRSVQVIQNRHRLEKALEAEEDDPVSVLSIATDGRSRMAQKIHPQTMGCCLL